MIATIAVKISTSFIPYDDDDDDDDDDDYYYCHLISLIP